MTKSGENDKKCLVFEGWSLFHVFTSPDKERLVYLTGVQFTASPFGNGDISGTVWT